MVEESLRLHEEDLLWVMARRSTFVEVDCPACESKARNCEFERDGFEFVRCQGCETLYISPRPDAALLAEFYASSLGINYWNDTIFPASEEARRESIFAPRAERVMALTRKHSASFDTLVDVGAGYGTFCEEAVRHGVFSRVVAVEPSQRLAATCRKKGLEVIESPIERAELRGVSVVTNFELIEHLFSPQDFVAACGSALPAGGLLILTTPNINGFDLATLGKLSDNILGPDHLNYFHPASLAILLDRCGFDVIDVATPGKLDAELVRKKALAGSLDLSGQPFLRQVLVSEWEERGAAFQNYLAANCLSSHLWVVARRR
jgi:2-polyprenyl-3-methyl-5-hydroxy-6-metoxy-1,4-benzoquinol methylase/ribosomal protein S27E